jgi:hypothetical protein
VRQTGTVPVFHSPSKATGSTHAIRFAVAGTYAYADPLHTSHTGTVAVPMTIAPESGVESTSFVVTWAAGTDPVVSGGWVVDVQVAAPGAADFSTWHDGVATGSASYVPAAGKGVYRFRTRLRHQTAADGSEWSPVASITVR